MASPSPAILPISNPQPAYGAAITNATTGSTDSALTPQGPPPAFLAFISQISDTIRYGIAARRPWSELLDRTAFNKPESLSEATQRIRKNYAYFRVNYITIITVVLAVSLLTNPFSLILFAGLLAAWLFFYFFRSPSDSPLTIFGRQFSDRETIGLLVVSTIFVVFLTSVGSVLVSALMVGVAIVAVHGAFRSPEDLFLDEQGSPATGFLSFLTAPAASAAAPVVAPRI